MDITTSEFSFFGREFLLLHNLAQTAEYYLYANPNGDAGEAGAVWTEYVYDCLNFILWRNVSTTRSLPSKMKASFQSNIEGLQDYLHSYHPLPFALAP